MVRKSLRNITPGQSENKKIPDYLEQIQDPLKALAYSLYEKRLLANTLKTFCPSQ